MATARIMTIRVSVDAGITALGSGVTPPKIDDIHEALMFDAPFSDYVIGVELMATADHPMRVDEFDVAISTEGRNYHDNE